MSETPLLRVEHLAVHFPLRSGLLARSADVFRAVDDVSFEIPRGQTLGLVGQSGSGKTTVGRAVVGLAEITGGKIIFDGVDLRSAQGRTHHRKIQMIFQDPGGSLNPRWKISSILAEPLILLGLGGKGADRRRRAAAVLEQCGLGAWALERYPHEFSGGQRQRIAIARALLCEPSLLVCDEPTSALDVSVQAQIINLLTDLQEKLGLACLFISHDLAVVRHVSDRIAVMHEGKLVEEKEAGALIDRPEHPYTRSLVADALASDPAAVSA